MKKIILVLLAISLLGACSSVKSSPDGVEDLRPGEKSVIQPPQSGQPARGTTLEEKNI